MITVPVKTSSAAYDVLISEDLLARLPEIYPAAQADEAVLVVADETTARLYGNITAKGLQTLGYRVEFAIFPPGEASKTQATLEQIYEAAFRMGLTRRDHMVALGGGVVGDLTGFAAATYMRGIPYSQIPTTLLAQVDSSVGGKTGIDTPYGKNLIGAFKQPQIVLADTSTLRTLSFKELASGMAEVIKYGLLESEEFFTAIDQLKPAPPTDEIIAACVRQKARIVAADEQEANIRAVLNLGHTFGHAIEKAGGYTRYLHGEAVALGMLAALRIGEVLGVTPTAILPRVQALLQRWDLPLSTDLTLAEILPNITADKKREGKGTKFVLLEDVGKPLLQWLGDEELAALAKALDGYILNVPATLPKEVTIRPGKLAGTILPPPSKSQAHRVIICTALASRELDFTRHITNYIEAGSRDIDTTTRNMRALLSAQPGETLTLDCDESGSTVRFLIPIAAALGITTVFTGRGRLPERPLSAYRGALEGHGVNLTFPEQGYLPLLVEGKLEAGAFEIPGDVSSQYITGMLFAMALLDEPSTLRLTTPLESAPYVDLTLETLALFGREVTVSDGLYTVEPKPWVLPAEPISIERDYSQAAFWYLAKFLGHPVEVSGMREDSLQGDRAIVDLLAMLEDTVEIDVSQIPDLFPALGVACAQKGEGKITRLVNAGRLRIKESDRLEATADMLGRLGVPCRQGDNWLEITAVKPLRGAVLDSYGDHRLAMAAAIAATAADGESRILRAEAVGKSYPSFYREFRRLGGALTS